MQEGRSANLKQAVEQRINEGNEVETIIHFESVLSTIEAKKILIHFRQNSKILKSF